LYFRKHNRALQNKTKAAHIRFFILVGFYIGGQSFAYLEVRGNAPKVNSGCLIELSRFKVRWDRPGGEAAFRHLHDNDLIKQDRRKNADRKK